MKWNFASTIKNQGHQADYVSIKIKIISNEIYVISQYALFEAILKALNEIIA